MFINISFTIRERPLAEMLEKNMSDLSIPVRHVFLFQNTFSVPPSFFGRPACLTTGLLSEESLHGELGTRGYVAPEVDPTETGNG